MAELCTITKNAADSPRDLRYSRTPTICVFKPVFHQSNRDGVKYSICTQRPPATLLLPLELQNNLKSTCLAKRTSSSLLLFSSSPLYLETAQSRAPLASSPARTTSNARTRCPLRCLTVMDRVLHHCHLSPPQPMAFLGQPRTAILRNYPDFRLPYRLRKHGSPVQNVGRCQPH